MTRRRHHSLIPLSHDHREALGLAFRLHNPAPPGPVTAMTPASTPVSRARETLEFFERHLRPHFRAEEEHLFPFLEENLDPDQPAHELMVRLRDEHRQFAALRDRLEAAIVDSPDLDPILTGFADLLEAHVRAEERQLFSIFPDDLPAALGERLAKSIRSALGRSS